MTGCYPIRCGEPDNRKHPRTVLHPGGLTRLFERAERARSELGDDNRIGSPVRFFDAPPKRPAAVRNAAAKRTAERSGSRYAVTFSYSPAKGIGKEPGVCRRDPSDVIQVGDTAYVWYSKTTKKRKLYPSGYNATVWYATSTDAGRTWTERGEAVGLGSGEAFDSFGVFTPNILVFDGNYYLFYTAVARGFTNRGYRDSGRTAIGVAAAGSPDGPWKKAAGTPVLASSRDPAKFDSYRVDDTCFVVRNGTIWMYYKGRQWERPPGQTTMGAATAKNPLGPYRRVNNGEPVQRSGHEVLVWPSAGGVMSLVSNTGPQGMTLQYAPDGIHFHVLTGIPRNYPKAPGAFRPDLTDPAAAEKGITWGIAMATYRGDPYLHRYEISLRRAAPAGR
jgi:hypothetical protein